MTCPNGHGADDNSGILQRPPINEVHDAVPNPSQLPEAPPEPATRAKQRARQQIQQNRFVIIGAGALVTALLIFVAVSMPRRGTGSKVHNAVAAERSRLEVGDAGAEKSLFPIIDSGRPPSKETHDGFLNERDLQRTASQPVSRTPPAAQTNAAGTLGSIPPFGEQTWQAPPYQPSSVVGVTDVDKAERESMEKSSLVFIGKVAPNPAAGLQATTSSAPELGLGLATGTRLRARLESTASTAVRTPVLAVIEYNYERDGEIIVPAGAKAVGHIRDANRSGYVDIQFDSLLMPDSGSIPIEAAATDLNLRPLKGKVEGKNAGKNILVRSLSGIGQAGSMLLGQNSLNQPLNESDLIRERVSSNIGQAGDEEVSRLAMNQRIVVTLSARIPIYVVMGQTAKWTPGSSQSAGRASPPASSDNIDQLHQLLQVQRELNQRASDPSTP